MKKLGQTDQVPDPDSAAFDEACCSEHLGRGHSRPFRIVLRIIVVAYLLGGLIAVARAFLPGAGH